jgi:MFS family permease
MLVAGLSMMMVALALIAASSTLWILAVAQTFLAFGYSFANPSTMGSISLLANQKEQGEALGTTQGTASLGRIIGPATGGWLYQNIGMGTPFLTGSLIACVALGIVLANFAHLPNSALKARST